MEQRAVISSAIILAIILAGVLWYGVSRQNNRVTSLPSPLASTAPDELSQVEAPLVATAEPVLPGSPLFVPASPTVAADITTAAPSGAAENTLVLAILASLAGFFQLRRTVRANTQR